MGLVTVWKKRRRILLCLSLPFTEMIRNKNSWKDEAKNASNHRRSLGSISVLGQRLNRNTDVTLCLEADTSNCPTATEQGQLCSAFHRPRDSWLSASLLSPDVGSSPGLLALLLEVPSS